MNTTKIPSVKINMAVILMAALTSMSSATLVAHFPMTEGAGTSLMDISGNDNDATLSGVSWNGSQVNFDGMSDHAWVAYSQSLNITTDSITIMAWIKWDIDPAISNQWATIVNMNSDNQYRLQHNKDNSAFEFAIRTTSGNKWVYSSTAPERGHWYHLAGTYNGSILNMYVNGLLENSVSHFGTIVGSNKSLIIGNRPMNDRGFSGSIMDVRIYDTALTQSEIRTVVAAPLMIPEPATLALLGLGGLGLRFKRK